MPHFIPSVDTGGEDTGRHRPLRKNRRSLITGRKHMSTNNNAAAAYAETPDIAPYTYIARGGQILHYLAANDFGDYNFVGRATHYVDKKLSDWEQAAEIAFGEYVGRVLGGGNWEYNGSTRWSAADPVVGMTVSVYESPLGDFAGDQLDALQTHPDTVFHGYVEFVHQDIRYSNAVVDLADIAAPRENASESRVRAAIRAVDDESREYNDLNADIAEALTGTAWDWVEGELVRRIAEAA